MGDTGGAVPAALGTEEWRDLDYRQSARALDTWSERKPERRRADDPTQYVAQMGITYDGCVTLMSRAHERVEVPPLARAALAALALHGQPFGFTHDDVRALRRLADGPSEAARRLRDIAARLEALLPPAG
jgi:hypothetical protein